MDSLLAFYFDDPQTLETVVFSVKLLEKNEKRPGWPIQNQTLLIIGVFHLESSDRILRHLHYVPPSLYGSEFSS